MKRGLYLKLAFTNIRKNKNAFFPFLLSAIAMVAMFYMLLAIELQSDGLYYGASYMSQILGFGVWVAGLISVIIIFYTNSFLMKQRTRELGLYNVLGMEKKHIAKVITWEIAIVAIGGIAAGLIFGIIFSKLLFLVLINMIGLDPKFSFFVSPLAVVVTVLVFGVVFAAAVLQNLLKAARLKPVDLMRETNAGEREPKAKWLRAFLGVVALGIGYEIALTTDNPLQALGMFFVAVILVIIGTYYLFVAGSIVLLKMLKKNKEFYYHKTHFVTVSGMMYRMKQNAMGLASICILVTMVIVVLSTTVSLYIGMEDEQRYRYPKDVSIAISCKEGEIQKPEQIAAQLKEATEELAQKMDVDIKSVESYVSYSKMYFREKGNCFNSSELVDYTSSDILNFQIMLTEEYNMLAKSSLKQKGDAPILIINKEEGINGSRIELDGVRIEVQNEGTVNEKFGNKLYLQAILLVSDYKEMDEICQKLNGKIKGEEEKQRFQIHKNYDFDLDGKWERKEAYGSQVKGYLKKKGIEDIYLVEDYYSTWQESLGLYASVLFIGGFIGFLFLVATVLIIYYKQISEGYGDQRNFQIMSKVGLANKEISQIINSQIRMVFLLPIIMAVVHICFAFPIIKNIMSMLNLTNVKLFLGCTVGTVLVFLLIYILVYKITSRVYYRIVEKR